MIGWMTGTWYQRRQRTDHDEMSKHKLSEVISFGEQLIQTGDLDPIYIALVKAELLEDQLKRLLLAYFCFYHLGASAWISEAGGNDFWELMKRAAKNNSPPKSLRDLDERWPRGAERRHFRGQKCIDAVEWLREYGMQQPEYLIDWLSTDAVSLPEIMQRVKRWPMFGDWIGFKIADMLERVLNVRVYFPDDLTLIYKEPRAALDMLDIPAEEANNKLLKHFSKFKAPPRCERNCNIQEVETICCKWKSSVGGHYFVGKDIHEVSKGLEGWGETAKRLHACMPLEVRQGLFK